MINGVGLVPVTCLGLCHVHLERIKGRRERNRTLLLEGLDPLQVAELLQTKLGTRHHVTGLRRWRRRCRREVPPEAYSPVRVMSLSSSSMISSSATSRELSVIMSLGSSTQARPA